MAHRRKLLDRCLHRVELTKISRHPNIIAKHLIARRRRVLASLRQLRGLNLACWCSPIRPCDADLLLKLAMSIIVGSASQPARARAEIMKGEFEMGLAFTFPFAPR
jgi:hypothetical protein